MPPFCVPTLIHPLKTEERSRGKSEILPLVPITWCLGWALQRQEGECGSERGKAGEETGPFFLVLGVKESVPDPWVIKSKIHPLKNRDILTYGTLRVYFFFVISQPLVRSEVPQVTEGGRVPQHETRAEGYSWVCWEAVLGLPPFSGVFSWN